MNFMKGADIKQFALVKYINENSGDESVMTRISIVLRRDKIEAPYYMDSKIRMSLCVDNDECGLVHAMDMLTHNRMHNLTEDAFCEIRKLLLDVVGRDGLSGQVNVSREDKRFKVVLTSRSDEEFENLFEICGELFERIDSLVE